MAVMRTSFVADFGEAWSAPQLLGTLGLGSSFARRAINSREETIGFTLARAAGPEVELLLIAVNPLQRGKGVGRLLLEAACRDSWRRGAGEIFLEVRENNAAARGLYSQVGFVDIGRRPNYYVGSAGQRFAAITMRRNLAILSA